MDDFGLLVSQFNTVLPTLTDTCMSELQVDDKGRLIISGRYFEDSGHVSGDAGLFAMGVRDDGVEASVIYDTVTFTADNPGIDGNNISLVFDGIDDLDTVVNAWNAANPTNTVSFSGQAGAYVPAGGTASLVNGADDTVFTDANYDYSPIAVDQYGRLKVIADLDVDFDYAYEEDSAHSSGDLGAYMLSVRADTRPTNANTNADGDYASLFVNVNGELYVHDTDLLAKLTELDVAIDALSHLEDSAHSSGDTGMMPLAVRHDADTSLVDTDGDYAPFQVDSIGRLKVVANLDAAGTEAYSVTDALAAAGDGLETITAVATPWITVASLAVGVGTDAYLYGWSWACDQNAAARIITDDTTDIKVYKVDINSSAQPGKEEHFSESGRIEISGAIDLVIKLQIKKRAASCGDANGTGALHIRTI